MRERGEICFRFTCDWLKKSGTSLFQPAAELNRGNQWKRDCRGSCRCTGFSNPIAVYRIFKSYSRTQGEDRVFHVTQVQISEPLVILYVEKHAGVYVIHP